MRMIFPPGLARDSRREVSPPPDGSTSSVPVLVPRLDTGGAQLRLQGLDTLRLACAVIVVLDHLHPTFPALPALLQKAYGSLLWGQPAVIVFFVISGLCIHYPQAGNSRPLPLVAFFLRRGCRLGIPLAALAGVSWCAGFNLWRIDQGVLWSLYCELVYYALYPGLLHLCRRVGWTLPTVAAVLLSGLEMIRVPQPTTFYHHGFFGMILLGLPIWLLGCVLAERIVHRREPAALASIPLAAWRIGMFAAGTLLNVLHFHAHLGYSWTLWAYALAVCPWIEQEVARAAAGVYPTLEALGRASYTIYIGHLPLEALRVRWEIRLSGGWPDFLLCMVWLTAGTSLFYRVVERPSTTLARQLGRWTRKVALTR